MAFAHLCISCGLCKEICPVDIDMPLMIAKVKEDDVAKNGQLRVNGFFTSSGAARQARLRDRARLELGDSELGQPLRHGEGVGVDRRRTLPHLLQKEAEEQARCPRGPQGSGVGRASVVFFPDIYADYNDPELGVRAIRAPAGAGYPVEVPAELKWGGMPYISYGELTKATEVAKYNLDVLEPFVSSGYGVRSTEPTASTCSRRCTPSSCPGASPPRRPRLSFGFFKLLQGSLPGLELSPAHPTEAAVGFHIPCHERALTGGIPAIAFLERAGYTVQVVETGTCCGMAGTFGMKHGALGYDLSMAVGDRLFKLFDESGTEPRREREQRLRHADQRRTPGSGSCTRSTSSRHMEDRGGRDRSGTNSKT